MCHMSHVIMCHMSCVVFSSYFFPSFFNQSGEVIWWRVCYQQGLPRLVFNSEGNKNMIQNVYTQVQQILIFKGESVGDTDID